MLVIYMRGRESIGIFDGILVLILGHMIRVKYPFFFLFYFITITIKTIRQLKKKEMKPTAEAAEIYWTALFSNTK